MIPWVVLIQFLNWSSIILVPLTLVFEQVHLGTINFMWAIDMIWCVEIILKFFRATEDVHGFKKTASRYLKSNSMIVVGEFWFDAAATIVPMIFLQTNLRVNVLKLLRLYYLSTMMLPFELLVKFCMETLLYKSNLISAVIGFMKFIISVMLMVHFAACAWISIGKSHDDLPTEDRASWISDPESDFVDMEWY